MTTAAETIAYRKARRYTPNEPIMSPNYFDHWLQESGPGDSLIYHVGNIPSDIAKLRKDEATTLIAVKGKAQAYERLGAIHLVQRRIAPLRAEYIARKR